MATLTAGEIRLTAIGRMRSESERPLRFTVNKTGQEMLLVNLSQEIRSQIAALDSADELLATDARHAYFVDTSNDRIVVLEVR